MGNHNLISIPTHGNFEDTLTEILREGARDLIAAAVDAELTEFMKQFEGQKAANGLKAVVRSGYQPERDIQTGIGLVRVQIPKIRSNTGEPVTFHSAVVPPYLRKTRVLENHVPWLHLKGISTGEVEHTMTALFGERARGFSPAAVSRLKRRWQQEMDAWKQRGLSDRKWAYMWADGIYSGVRNEDVRLCTLVVIGVDEYGFKDFLAIEDGMRESTLSWHELLLNLKNRGMNAPRLAVGDGALGFWSALDRAYPETRQQRCRVHKTANVPDAPPKALQAQAKTSLQQIRMAGTREAAHVAFDTFIDVYRDKHPKAAQCLMKDREELLAFYDFPAKRRQSIRTTNPMESAFSTIRHRTERSKGCSARSGMLCMMLRLGQCAQQNRRRLRGFKELGKVIEGMQFRDGIEEKQETDQIAA